MKDYYTKAQRAAYMRAYNARRNNVKVDPRKDVVGPPTPQKCLCTRDWGMNLRGSEWICHRCKELENVDFHTTENYENAAIIKNISPAWLLRQLQPYQRRLKAWIDDRGSELVVHGHGEYHLTLTP